MTSKPSIQKYSGITQTGNDDPILYCQFNVEAYSMNNRRPNTVGIWKGTPGFFEDRLIQELDAKIERIETSRLQQSLLDTLNWRTVQNA